MLRSLSLPVGKRGKGEALKEFQVWAGLEKRAGFLEERGQVKELFQFRHGDHK